VLQTIYVVWYACHLEEINTLAQWSNLLSRAERENLNMVVARLEALVLLL
jgi:hypothetical protein